MMADVSHPLEQRVYFWLMANVSRIANNTFLPAFLPPGLDRDSWVSQDLLFNLAPLQDVSLGVFALLALHESVSRSKKLSLKRVTILPDIWIQKILDIIVVNLLKTIVGLILLIVLLPLVLPVLFVFWLMACVTKITYNFKYGRSVTKAEGMDSVWGLESTESRPFITICLLVSGSPDLPKICRHVQERILEVREEGTGDYKYKKFRQMFSQRCGYYSWTDAPDFNIQNHVRMISLDEFYPEASASTHQDSSLGNSIGKTREEEEKQDEVGRSLAVDELVQRWVSEEGGSALSADRPPWELLLLPRKDNRYNVVIRLHHAIGDGVTLVRLCVESLVDTPLSPPPVGPPPAGPLLRAAMMVWSCLVLPLGLLQVVANFDHNSLHGPALSGRKLMKWSRGLPLAAIKKVKTAAGATVNDVLMSCLAAALSRHFARRSERVGQVTAIVPVSFHDLQAPLKLTNRFSVAALRLPASHGLTPMTRLHATKSVLGKMKRDPTLAAVYWVVGAVSGILPAPVAQFLLSGRGVTLAASNVPGPQQEISVWGERVEDMLFWIPNRSPVGVGVSIASYLGTVRVALNIDAALVCSSQEAQALLDDMEEELYRLHRHLLQDH